MVNNFKVTFEIITYIYIFYETRNLKFVIEKVYSELF